MRAFVPGETIDGFRIVRPLGQGGMGAVHLAHDVSLDRPTALKVIRAEEPTPELHKRFLTEARVLARLQHPNVVGVYRYGEFEGQPYLAYEFIEGRSLEGMGPLAWPRVLAIGLGLAGGIAAAHQQGVLHRDIKPANVLVTPEGVVKLLDFGLAVLAEDNYEDRAGLTQAGRVPGTPAYIAPERWFGAPPSTAADVWAFGMVLRELLVGAHPFYGVPLADLPGAVTRGDLPPLRTVVPGVPAAFAEFVDRCVALHEWRRPRAGAAAYESLRSIQTLLDAFDSGTPAARHDVPGVVAASFARVLPRAQALGVRFYERLFVAHPALRRLFPAALDGQREKLVTALHGVVDQLRDPDALAPHLRELGRRHAGYGVQDAHYAWVGEALVGALAELDPGWTPEVEGAWAEAWRQIAHGMRAGMATKAATSETLLSGMSGDAPLPPPRPAATSSASTASLPSIDTSCLPASITRFYGRDVEIDALAGLVGGGARLVTVLGMGGVGKSRLAVEAARKILAVQAFQRVAWVPLADAGGRDAAVQAILRGLAVKDVLGDPLDALAGAVATGRTLLLLDNLEHLVDALADDLGRLLERAPGLVCLVTSQRALELFGETVFRLAPLPLPAADGPVAELEAAVAVQLFADRARLQRPDFRLDAANVPLVAELARRLDGLPLAIELAAARAGLTDLAALLARLDADLGALADRSRNRPDRQRSLHSALRWTTERLSPDRLRRFARLSVFPGELDADDAAAVLEDPGVEDALLDLTQCSLLVPVDGAPGRYRALSTVRAYAASLLDADEAAALLARFRAHFIALADRWADALGTPAATPLSARLDRSWPNLMAALDGVSAEEQARVLGRIPIHVLWTARFPEMLPRYDPYLDEAVLAGLAPQVRANLVRAGHRLSNVGGDARRALAWRAEVRRALAGDLPDASRRGLESELVVAAIDQGALDEAERIAASLHAHEMAHGTLRSRAVTLDSLSRVAYFRGDYAVARERGAGAWALAGEAGDPQLREVILAIRAAAAASDGDLAEAHALLDLTLEMRRAAGLPAEDGSNLALRVYLALYEGRTEEAWTLAVAGERGNRRHGRLHVYSLDLLTEVAFARGDHARAVAEGRRAVAGFTALLRPLEVGRPATFVARALRRLGDPGADDALAEATRATLAVQGHRHARRLLEAWAEARPDRAFPAADTLADGAWRALFTPEGRLVE